MSDFLKMTVVVMKTYFQKLQPKRMEHQNYKAVSNEIYSEDLVSKLSHETIYTYMFNKFLEICIDDLNQHVFVM